jgi:hypothetical protein
MAEVHKRRARHESPLHKHPGETPYRARSLSEANRAALNPSVTREGY